MKVKVIKKANTNKRYEPEFKKKMVRLVLEEGRTIASVNKEYNQEKELSGAGSDSLKKNAKRIQK